MTVVCRLLPGAVVTAAVVLSATGWSRLPKHAAWPFVLTALSVVVGLALAIPEFVSPSVPEPEQFTGPLDTPFFGSSLLVAWVWTKLGRAATGMFFLASGCGVATAIVVASSRAPRMHLPAAAVFAALGAAAVLAVVTGVTLRAEGKRIRTVPTR